MSSAINYCQGLEGAPLNAYVCSTSPPTPPIVVRRTMDMTGIIELIATIGLIVGMMAFVIYRWCVVENGNTRAQRRASVERKRVEQVQQHEQKMAQLEIERQKEINRTLADYKPTKVAVRKAE